MNFSGNNARYYLNLNGHKLSDVYVDMPFNNILTLAYDSSISKASDYTGSILQTLGGIIQTGIGVASIASGAGASIGAIQLGQGVGQIASGISGIESISTAHQTGSYSTIGGASWNISEIENARSILLYQYYPQIDRANFNAKYGLPSNTVETLSSLGTGYAQTQACKLLQRGFPK